MTEQEEANKKLDEYHKLLLDKLDRINIIFEECLKQRQYKNVEFLVDYINKLDDDIDWSKKDNYVSYETFLSFYPLLYKHYYKVFVDNLPEIKINKDLVYPDKNVFQQKLNAAKIDKKVKIPKHPFVKELSNEPKEEVKSDEPTTTPDPVINDLTKNFSMLSLEKNSKLSLKKRMVKKEVKRRV